ncbi:MAG: DUF4292 domain-containing protein [Bacteroidetes bacterium]|nr:DUF4292 domain-containing protein [Bacteroidota bacterium]
MEKNMLNKLLVVFGIVGLVSCKAHRQLVSTPARSDSSKTAIPVIPESKLHEIKAAQLNFNTFSGRAKTTLSINGKSNDVTMNIRISKGQKIWISITALAGIEVARAVITPDSIKAVNKLQDLYLKKPFSYIYKYTGSSIDYNSVEALFVGNAIPQLLNGDAKMQTDSTGVALSGNLDELVYKLVIGPDLKARETDLNDPSQPQSLQVNNSAFIPVANRTLPSQVDISSVAGLKKLRMNMHYVRADFDQPLEYPFNIPTGYEEAK